ncbi:MAG TPA: LamG domain-containing protein, partial [Anaerolineales bacterium]
MMSSIRVFKVFVFAFLLVALSIGLELRPAQAAPAAGECGSFTGLVACWRMEENGGTKLIDWSGNGLDANIVGTMAWGPGKVGTYSLFLDDKNPYASVSYTQMPQITNAISVAAWINPKAIGNQTIISKYASSSIDGYQFSLAGDSAPVSGHEKRVYFRLNQKSSTNTYRVSSMDLYAINAWTFFVATFDGTDNSKPMKIYKNGELNILGGNPVTGPNTIATNNLDLNIGKENSSAYNFWGSLDDVRIYNRALTADEIRALFASPTAVNLASFT